MSESIRLYAGTQRGLFVWRSKNGGWEDVYSGFEGAIIDAMAECHHDASRVFVGLTQDGLYRTVDAGKSWSRVIEGDIRSVSVDPTDDRVIYCGTEPVHLYRSEDGGDS